MIESRHSLLKKLVEMHSPSGKEAEISKFCQRYLKRNGFKVETVDIGDERKSILATKGSRDKSVAFYGHLDTVHPEEDKWDTDKPAWEMTRIGDRYYGLGTSDMKSGIWAVLEALKDTDKYVKAIFTVDEEEISTGAWRAVEKRPNFFADVELLISAEAESSHGGSAITVGRPGRQVYEATFQGVGTHLMHYEDGIDAIQQNTEFLNKFYRLRDSGKLITSPYSKAQIRRISGESIGMSVPAFAQSEIEILQGSEDDPNEIATKLRSIVGNYGELKSKVRVTPYLPGYYTKEFPYSEEINRIVKVHTGNEAELFVRPSVGDENVFSTLVKNIITWGPTGGNEHTANEYIEIASLDRTVSMYKSLLEKIRV